MDLSLSSALSRQWPGQSASEHHELQQVFRPVDLPKGATLLAAGDTWQNLVWVQRGALRLFCLDLQGNEWNKSFHLEGAWLWPITALMREEPADFFIAALEPTRVQLAPIDRVESLLSKYPEWAATRARTLERLLDDKLRREQWLVQSSASQRYERLCAEHPDWLERIALRHLASYLGMTDVSLSRLRRQP